MLRDESKSYSYKLNRYLAVRCKTRAYNESRELARESLTALDFPLSVRTIQENIHYVPLCEVNMLFNALHEATSAPSVDTLLGLLAQLTAITIQRSPESKPDLLQQWRQMIKLLCERQANDTVSIHLAADVLAAIATDGQKDFSITNAIREIITDDAQLEKLIDYYCKKREFPFAKENVKLLYLQKQFVTILEQFSRGHLAGNSIDVYDFKKNHDLLSTILSQTWAIRKAIPDYKIPIETLGEILHLVFSTYSDEKFLDIKIHYIYDLIMQYQHTEYQEMAAFTLMQVYCEFLVQFPQDSIIEILMFISMIKSFVSPDNLKACLESLKHAEIHLSEQYLTKSCSIDHHILHLLKALLDENYNAFTEELIDAPISEFAADLYYLFIRDNTQLQRTDFRNDIPLLIQLDLHHRSEEFQTRIMAIYRRAITINQNVSDDQHKRDPATLFMQIWPLLCQYIEITGEDAFKQINELLANTLIPLEDFFSRLTFYTNDNTVTKLTTYCKEYRPEIISDKQTKESWNLILQILSIADKYKDLLESEFHISFDDLLKLATESHPNQSWRQLIDLLIAKMIPPDIAKRFEEKLQSNSVRLSAINNFATIFDSYVRMKTNMDNSPYCDAYLRLFALDLIGESNSDFLHDTTQDNPIGIQLATHNQNIRKLLSAQHIDPSNALEYSQVFHFIVTPNSEEALSQMSPATLLWNDLLQLKNHVNVNPSEPSIQKNLKDLHKEMTELERKVSTVSKKKQENILNSSGVTPHFRKINQLLAKLKSQARNQLPTQFHEFADHYQDHFRLYDAPIAQASSVKSERIPITVLEWSKDHPDTFFLGDAVGCCLASGATQFPAMVQRRLDDAALFHVAIDQSTKKPIALIWLYLAKTADGKIVLVANFFEVNIKYALNPNLRISILQGMLAFTDNYLKANPNISGFYMNPLTYGHNILDLTDYPTERIHIVDKIGGPFIPSDYFNSDAPIETTHDPDNTNKHYYLASLTGEPRDFHKYSNEVFAATHLKTWQPLSTLMNSWMEKLLNSKPSLNFADASKTFLHEHRQDLEPFYSSALESNASLIATLKDCYKQTKTRLSGHETTEPLSEAASAAAPATAPAATMRAHGIFPPVSPSDGSRRPSDPNKSKRHGK